MNADDIELTLRARAVFNESVDRLDADTRQRLREARLRALKPRARPAGARWLWPAGAAIAAALVVAVLLPHLPQSPGISAGMPAVAHATPASNPGAGSTVGQTATADPSDAPSLETTDPEMLADLEFYGWLATQPGTPNPGG